MLGAMLKAWKDLTPDERLELVNIMAYPGLTWAQRVMRFYEYMRIEGMKDGIPSGAAPGAEHGDS